MQPRSRLTTLVGAALAVVTAGFLILFFMIAQQEGLESNQDRALKPVSPGAGQGDSITFEDPSSGESPRGDGPGESTGNPFDRVVPLPTEPPTNGSTTLADPSPGDSGGGPASTGPQGDSREGPVGGPLISLQEPDGDQDRRGVREPYSGAQPPGPTHIIDDPDAGLVPDAIGLGAETATDETGLGAATARFGTQSSENADMVDIPATGGLRKNPCAELGDAQSDGKAHPQRDVKQKDDRKKPRDRARGHRDAKRHCPKCKAKEHRPSAPRGNAHGHSKPPPPRGNAHGHSKPPPPRGNAHGHQKSAASQQSASKHDKSRPPPSSSHQSTRPKPKEER